MKHRRETRIYPAWRFFILQTHPTLPSPTKSRGVFMLVS